MKEKISIKPNLGENLPQYDFHAKDILGQDLYAGDIITFSTRKGLSFGMLLDKNYIYRIICRKRIILDKDFIHYHHIYDWYAVKKRFYSFGTYCLKIDPKLISNRDMKLYNGYKIREIKTYIKDGGISKLTSDITKVLDN
ncbi:MAG TPA: hypothetical protein P5513_02690 [Candidatus Diapherotrites archaeon]|nr:hypothetical protein [Candidatus Diapherotrites archaeon]